MEPIHRIVISILAFFLVVAGAATAYHVYEQRLSYGYVLILQSALTSSYEERAAYIHEARAAVRTDKDREAEAKLEKMQKDLSDDIPPACKSLQSVGEAVAMSSSPIGTSDAFRACIDADKKAKQAEGGRLWAELCADARVSAN